MDDDDEEKYKLINEEYKIWKQNTPFLYDLLITHALRRPSLTVEWLPDPEKPADQDYAVQKLILGTHTSGDEPNHLIIAQVRLPFQYYEMDDQSNDQDRSISPSAKVLLTKQINHDGEVNRARSMPQVPLMIATKTVSGEVYLFDSREHPSMPSDGVCSPDLRLRGHTDEGFGLSWSNLKIGHLLSAADDSQICLWDIAATPTDKAIDALRTFKVNNEDAVTDVAWHMSNEYLFGSVGEDKYLHIWDLRKPSVTNSVQSCLAHQSEINCLAFNPREERTLVTGSSDTTIKLFDLRKIGTPVHTFNSHKEGVFQVGWNPKNETILASSCAGRRVLVWDVSRLGEEQTPEEADDSPPELLFIHSGHTSKITDFSWNPCEEWIMGSVSDDNILQIWQMADHIYGEDGDDFPPDDSTMALKQMEL